MNIILYVDDGDRQWLRRVYIPFCVKTRRGKETKKVTTAKTKQKKNCLAR